MSTPCQLGCITGNAREQAGKKTRGRTSSREPSCSGQEPALLVSREATVAHITRRDLRSHLLKARPSFALPHPPQRRHRFDLFASRCRLFLFPVVDGLLTDAEQARKICSRQSQPLPHRVQALGNKPNRLVVRRG